MAHPFYRWSFLKEDSVLHCLFYTLKKLEINYSYINKGLDYMSRQGSSKTSSLHSYISITPCNELVLPAACLTECVAFRNFRQKHF